MVVMSMSVAVTVVACCARGLLLLLVSVAVLFRLRELLAVLSAITIGSSVVAAGAERVVRRAATDIAVRTVNMGADSM